MLEALLASGALEALGGGGAAGGGMLGGLGGALSLGGTLGGLFGKKAKQKNVPIAVPSDFGQQSKENQKKLQKQLEDYFINAQYGDFFGRPMRRVGLGDMNGEFTPRGLFEFQDYLDQQAMRKPVATPAQAPQQAAPQQQPALDNATLVKMASLGLLGNNLANQYAPSLHG